MSALGSRYRIVDATTGEDLGPARERRSRTRTLYTQTARRARAARAELARKSVTALCVLEWLCRQAGTAGGVRVSQSAVAQHIQSSRQAVSQALGLLETMGFVASEPGSGRQKTYFVDPEYDWSGPPSAAVMATALFYRARRAAGAAGVPAWREGPDPWRLSREERLTIAYIPDGADDETESAADEGGAEE